MHSISVCRMDCFKSSSKWLYRGEGNATLVIHCPSARKVLRLRKAPVNTKKSAKPEDIKRSQQTSKEEITRSVDFYQDVFVTLLGENYVHPGTVVKLPKNFVTGVNDLVTSANCERPFHRLKKEVAAECLFGVLMPDLCFVSDCSGTSFTDYTSSPTFCVEIKPKCGILPACSSQDDENSVYHKVKQLICKYCLFQWQKVDKERKYPRRSEYCPLDLFSNDPGRVLYALKCLLQDPQNNLRIFKDGTLVYSGESNLQISGSVPSVGKAPYPNEVSSANGLPSNHSRLLLEFEDMLKSSFITSLNDTVSDGSLSSSTGCSTSFSHSSIFLATLLQLLVDDSKRESTIDDNHQPSNQPVCVESNYHQIASLENDVQSLLSTLPHLTFGKRGILNKILNVQKLDRFGTDEIFTMYEDVCNNANMNSLLQSYKFSINQTIDDGRNSGSTAAQHTTFKYFENRNYCQNDPPHENLTLSKDYQNSCEQETSVSFKLDKIIKFLIAASANDCSIMISFQQVEEPNNCACYFKEAVTGLHYKYSIAAVDLDPKNIDRIPKYYHEYHEIVGNYLHYSKNKMLH